MNYLLAADLHLTDAVIDEYRWRIFDHLASIAKANEVRKICLLGDVWDRKDRHTGKLVNRIIDELHTLYNVTGAWISILAGNHDAPLEGVHYWEFLNKYAEIEYITKPKFDFDGRVLLLPFSPNPVRDWSNLETLKLAKAIFMHQPVQGAFIDEYRKIERAPLLPSLPDIPIFSGDIHNPQTLNNIVYIGIPHPVHFNENWSNRVILIKDLDFKNYNEISIPTIKRSILEIGSADELITYNGFKQGDQLRIKVKLEGKNLSNWPAEEQKIKEWAVSKEIHLASIEAFIVGDSVKGDEKVEVIDVMAPEQVLQQYAEQEKLSEDVIDVGLSLLKES